jgi:biopolymer transport protein ExbD
MKFLTRRRKAAPAIIIISLIDVLVVLMVFLMVTTRFKSTPSVALTLPETREAPKAGASAEKPPMMVTIAAVAPQFYVGPRAVTSDKLLNELKDAVAADSKVVKFGGDESSSSSSSSPSPSSSGASKISAVTRSGWRIAI